MSYSSTESASFTEVHAKKIASRVATDLKRMQRYYGSPSDSRIADFEKELIELLKKGYIDRISYGFKKDGKWVVPMLQYTAKQLADFYISGDDPGNIEAGADVKGASFYSMLVPNSKWENLSAQEQADFEKDLPIKRGYAEAPGMNGYMSNDKSYSAGGVALDRSSLKSY